MITADEFIAAAKAHGHDFYTGVPCSFLTPLINGVLSSRALTYVGAASEGEAVAIAAGAWLAGRKTVVMCQNSGLGNAVNPLTSLNAPFRIPTLFVTTWRGQPGQPDEPQHEVMGRITQDLLALIEVPQAPFPATVKALGPALDQAAARMDETGLPYAFVMKKGDVRDEALRLPEQSGGLPPEFRGETYVVSPLEHGPRPTRAAVLERFLALTDDRTAVVATTGKAGRELFTLADRPQHIYQVGSMGGASGMALGVALNTTAPVVVLDGDGAALMKLGTFATIGAQAPGNLIHILLDNGVHDSTGGQPTVSASVDFARIALACGYRFATTCDSLDGFESAYRLASGVERRPALIHVRIAPGSMDKLGRPTVGPADVARRFQDFLAGLAPATTGAGVAS
ncbi:MAG: phosphonopyruvate decarboxylase [Inquilinus limosus]|uniref:Phosphonopyruvate decarboxylase n=1 Tax=Inquilinus limosus TaxID=171674 RepID=A0A952FI59_9PROT|nr:phosphonopyruvate decarboxylase [Inquilinus limosus]